MRILLCPDKFKGSLSAVEVCDTLAEGLKAQINNVEIISHPLADGGDGSIAVLKKYLALESISVDTVNPLGRQIKADYYAFKDTAFIELASASGLVLLSEADRNPIYTSTLGAGLMIKNALERGYKNIYLFIGGSATNDAGIGIACALGFVFLDKDQNKLEPIGGNLIRISSMVNKSEFNFDEVNIKVMCDVTNPMYGEDGAAYVYAAQKNASPKEIETLDKGLINFAQCLNNQIEKDLSKEPGMGAAGAVGASLVGLMKAELQIGFQMIAEFTHLEQAMQDVDFVITGEGKIDDTSFKGKVVGNVLALCEKYKIKCGIVGGKVDPLFDNAGRFEFVKSVISYAEDFEDAMQSPKKYLKKIGEEIGLVLKQGRF